MKFLVSTGLSLVLALSLGLGAVHAAPLWPLYPISVPQRTAVHCPSESYVQEVTCVSTAPISCTWECVNEFGVVTVYPPGAGY